MRVYISDDADDDVTWCDIQESCYDCPFYMDDCDGDEAKMDQDFDSE